MTRPGSGPYHIQIDGLPSGYTWQDLKDLIRPTATHGVWTRTPMSELYSRNQRARQDGCVRMTKWSEAKATYQYLGQRNLHVELWDITSPPARIIDRNYEPENGNAAVTSHEITRLAQNPSLWHGSPVAPASVGYSTAPMGQYADLTSPSLFQSQQPDYANYNTAQLNALQAQQIAAQQALAHQQALVQQQHQALVQQAFAVQARARQQTSLASEYATSASGLPVNTRRGTVMTQSRAVFVSKLSFQAQEVEIKDLFAGVGEVVACKLQKDPRTAKSKGYAQIEYASAEEAKAAVDKFDGRKFMGMTLHVRFDKNTTTVNPPSRVSSEPVIVDSSMGRGSR